MADILKKTVDLEAELSKRFAPIAASQVRAKSQLIPNNFFDLSDSGLPSDYIYMPLDIPNPHRPFYEHQLAALREAERSGFQYLPTDLVSRDGSNGRATIPNFVEVEGRVTIANCYIMFAGRDWYNERRNSNTKVRNDKLERQTTSSSDKKGEHGMQTLKSETKDVTLEDLLNEE